MHDDVIPNEGTINSNQIVESLIVDWLILLKIEGKQLAIEAVVVCVKPVLHIPGSFSIILVDTSDNLGGWLTTCCIV